MCNSPGFLCVSHQTSMEKKYFFFLNSTLFLLSVLCPIKELKLTSDISLNKKNIFFSFFPSYR